ncbi:hypothetical protein AGMMS49942_15020 [Spirochaetia bacterium]|nr:hypothetical protein AGMMS49942_15020 [Spirochaetia bacterium]
MTLRQTIDIPASRKVHDEPNGSLDLVVPETVSCGRTEVILDFPQGPPKTSQEDWRSLYGLCKDSGDTLDAFMERRHEDGRLELENEERERRERL